MLLQTTDIVLLKPTGGADYIGEPFVIFNFSAGSAIHERRCINYTMVDDSDEECIEHFKVLLSTSRVDRVTVDQTAFSAVVSIIDDDGMMYLTVLWL